MFSNIHNVLKYLFFLELDLKINFLLLSVFLRFSKKKYQDLVGNFQDSLNLLRSYMIIEIFQELK